MPAYITGIGKTKFGVLTEGIPELMQKAAMDCMADAGRQMQDVDAVIIANFAGGPQASQLHTNSLFSSIFPEFRGPSMRVEAACASGGVAIAQAVRNLKDPRVRNVLVVGVEKLSGRQTRETTTSIAMAGDRRFDQSVGMIFPAAYALMCQAHMAAYGTTLDDLAAVALKNHSNANLNPKAHFYGKAVTKAAVDASPEVCSPLRLFDCSPITDGAAAVLISSEKNGNSIEVTGSSVATDPLSLIARPTLTSMPAARRAASDALAQARVPISTVDVIEVHDCFTIAEIMAYEDLGLCKPGQGAELVRSGETTLGGRIPVNPDGGLKADGHPIGATGVRIG